MRVVPVNTFKTTLLNSLGARISERDLRDGNGRVDDRVEQHDEACYYVGRLDRRAAAARARTTSTEADDGDGQVALDADHDEQMGRYGTAGVVEKEASVAGERRRQRVDLDADVEAHELVEAVVEHERVAHDQCAKVDAEDDAAAEASARVHHKDEQVADEAGEEYAPVELNAHRSN